MLSYGWHSLAGKDRTIIFMLFFFLTIALTLELYWVWYADQLVARAKTDWIAFLFSLYGVADGAYYDAVTPFSLGLETFNVFVTQIFNIALIRAIWYRKAYRYALQLAVSSYMTYSVILYFWVIHLSGYADMTGRSLYTAFMLVAPNLPWLLGYLYLGMDAYNGVLRERLRHSES